MKKPTLLSALALAATSLASHAVVLSPLDLTTGSTFFGNTPVAGGFSDTTTFTLTGLSILNASITSVVNDRQDVDFSVIFITGPSGFFSLTSISADPVEVWATPAAGYTLAAGTYTLTLAGVNSAAIGSYAGNVGVTPVPEPGSVPLMLAGAGVIGLLIRRRSPA